MSKKWFIKEGGQVCFKSDNAELNGWDTQSLVDCLNGKEIKIADLEAKLAKSENQCRECKHLNKKIELNIKNKLMSELAEKENKEVELREEIARLNSVINENKKEIKGIKNSCDYYMNRANDLLLKDQDKISFAVEQLEKVKEYAKNNSMLMNAESFEDDDLGEKYLNYFIFADNFYYEIDNQIKQLKEK